MDAAGSVAKRAIALIAERGAMRTDQIAEALGVDGKSISNSFGWPVKNGTLVMCKVERPGTSPVNEYRISAGGTALEFKQLKVKATPRAAPAAEAALEQVKAFVGAGRKAQRAVDLRINHADLRQADADETPTKSLADVHAPTESLLEITAHVPCPGPRTGKGEVLRDTLFAMHGDDSFLVSDVTWVYEVAKRAGIRITSRREGAKIRVWRIS